MMPYAAGSEIIFTVSQQLDMSGEKFAEGIRLVEQDLNSLKSLMQAAKT